MPRDAWLSCLWVIALLGRGSGLRLFLGGEREPVRTLLTGLPTAWSIVGAVPEAAVGVVAQAPSWSAVFVGHWCRSGQGVLPPRAEGAARQAYTLLF
jgi:hypothetical protein